MKLLDILYLIRLVLKVLMIIACVVLLISEPCGYNTGENYGSTEFWFAKIVALIYLSYLCWKHRD
jgi:hypothetical protein